LLATTSICGPLPKSIDFALSFQSSHQRLQRLLLLIQFKDILYALDISGKIKTTIPTGKIGSVAN
jgi:hypothetical protein